MIRPMSYVCRQRLGQDKIYYRKSYSIQCITRCTVFLYGCSIGPIVEAASGGKGVDTEGWYPSSFFCP